MYTLEELNKIFEDRGWEEKPIYNVKTGERTGIAVGITKHGKTTIFGRGNNFEEAMLQAIDNTKCFV